MSSVLASSVLSELSLDELSLDELSLDELSFEPPHFITRLLLDIERTFKHFKILLKY